MTVGLGGSCSTEPALRRYPNLMKEGKKYFTLPK